MLHGCGSLPSTTNGNSHPQLPQRLAHSGPVRGSFNIAWDPLLQPLMLPGAQGQLCQEHNVTQPTSIIFGHSYQLSADDNVRPGSIEPMTAVVQRVKGFAYYSLSFSRHNKNIKMEDFFLYILSRYFIWLHKWKVFNDICASLKYETNDWLFFSALFNTFPAQM